LKKKELIKVVKIIQGEDKIKIQSMVNGYPLAQKSFAVEARTQLPRPHTKIFSLKLGLN
jgi:hypothetical protein